MSVVPSDIAASPNESPVQPILDYPFTIIGGKRQSFNSLWYKNLMQKHLQYKKGPSKVESYLEVDTLADWQQQDLISGCSQGLAY